MILCGTKLAVLTPEGYSKMRGVETMRKCGTLVKKSDCQRNSQGFTLAEMIIVMAIIFIVSAVAIPNILLWREKAQLSQAARDVYSEFQRAKIRAAQENSYCSILFDSAKFLVFVDANKNIVYDGGEEVIKTKNWSDYAGVILNTSQGGGDGLTFSNPGNGIAFSSTGIPINNLGGLGMGSVFLINGRGDTASIVVSAAGSVRID